MKNRTNCWSWILSYLALPLVLGGMTMAEKGGKPGGGGGGGGAPPYDPAIAYATWHCSGGSLYAMNADGSNKTLLVENGGHPTWIPGSSWILFNYSGILLDGDGMYVLNALDPGAMATKVADSSGCVEYVLANPADPDMAAWFELQETPGGAGYIPEVQFAIQDPGGSWGVVTVDTFPDLVLLGAWSPDGTRIAAEVWNSVNPMPEGDWLFEVVYDQDGVPTGLARTRDVSSTMTEQGWDMGASDWSARSDRWLLMNGSRGSNQGDVFLVDLHADPPIFHNLTNNEQVSHRNPKWSPCDDRVLVEAVSNPQSIGGMNHKLEIYDLAFDDVSGDFIGVTNSGGLPSSRKEQFFWADWRSAGPGGCTVQ